MTVDAIIDELGGTGAVADLLGVSASTVSSWRSRGSIPSEHWLSLARHSVAEGKGISLELLAEAHARRGEPAEARP